MFVKKWALPFALVLAMLGLSAPAQAAPIPVTITVTGAQVYGGQPAFAGQTGVSGLTVTGVRCTGLTSGASIAPALRALQSYAISGATCSGGTLSSPGYTIAGYSGSTFTVYRAPLTVRAGDRTRVYGDGNPSLGYTVTGFVNGEDSSALTGAPTLATTATPSSDVGAYPITVSAGTLASPPNNYFFKYEPGSLTVTPKPVSVTVGGAQNYGGQPVFSGATGVTGLAVSGVSCTGVTGGQAITPTLPAGAYTTDPATCSGGVLSSGNYQIAAYRSASFPVYKAALTVTATDASREYGVANPAFAYTVTGFQNGEDASAVTGAPSLTTTATGSSDVGSYPITPKVGTLSSANYRFVFVPGTLTVAPKRVQVTVSGAQNYGGQAVFAGRTGVTGLTVTDVTCTGLTGGQSVAPALPAGSYSVDPATCSGGVLSSSNYEIASYRSAGFLVYKAPLTVTANDQSRVYGFANPTLGYTITGFQNGETTTVISGEPVLATTAVVKSNAGTYPITVDAGSLSAANYRFVLVGGTLTVTRKQLIVKADPATRGYGEAPPAYTATITGFRNGDTAASLSGAPAFSTTATAASEPGTYPLTVAQGTLDSPNYTFAGFTADTLTITSGVATITTRKMVNGVLSATVTYGAASTPVVGSTITFTVGTTTTVACTAVTNAAGTAECTASGLARTNITLGGYTARFPGTANLLPAEKHQGIL